MLKIVKVPHKALSSPTVPIKKIDEKIRQLVYDMEETLVSQVEPQGVGLAAPQVGLNLALFIMKPSLKSNTEVCINPKILEMVEHEDNDKKETQEEDPEEHLNKLEGCLSIPRIWGPVKRAAKIHLTYQNLKGEQITRWFSGFKAIIVQHEMDHLKGVMFTQRALEQKTQLYEEKKGELHKMEY